MPDTISVKSRVQIRGVLPPLDSAIPKVLLHLGAILPNQRPDDIANHRPDTGQPGGPGTSQETKKDRLRLVGSGMPDSDAAQRAAIEELQEEAVPGAPRGLFQVVASGLRDRGNIGLPDLEGQP